MDGAKRPRKRTVRCCACRKVTPEYDITHSAPEGEAFILFCNRCLNARMAEKLGVDGFEHIDFEPISLADVTGRVHKFHFATHLFEEGVSLEAFEVDRGQRAGYEFGLIGEQMVDPMALLGRLIEKMRRGLAMTHLRSGPMGLEIAEHKVRGRIGCEPGTEGSEPYVVIDGREISWEYFGRMLTTFEGWQFKLDIYDSSEEM